MELTDVQQHVARVDTLPNPESGYFLKLVEEVGELAQAIRKGRSGQPTIANLKGSVAEELVDVLYYVAAIANQHNVDLAQTFAMKEELNKKKYNR